MKFLDGGKLAEVADGSSRGDGEGVCACSTINVEAGRAGCREAVGSVSTDDRQNASCCRTAEIDRVVAVGCLQNLDARYIIEATDGLSVAGQGHCVVAAAACEFSNTLHLCGTLELDEVVAIACDNPVVGSPSNNGVISSAAYQSITSEICSDIVSSPSAA